MSLFAFLQKKLPIDTAQIEAAIAHLEQQTSAELRVVVERKAKIAQGQNAALERANTIFTELNMHQTQARNGVLIYLSFKPKSLAVVGDLAIHEKVTDTFWQNVYAAMKQHCQAGDFTQAICLGIAQVEKELAHYFPRQADDVNELSNEVVIK